MRWNRSEWSVGCYFALGVLAFAATRSHAAAAHAPACEKIVLAGEVSAGQEWKAAFGQGWVFRVLPIQPGNAGYSGWDLVVDREQAAGFPDALLLATPPYDSINEREIGTTFGLRAQDAIGWNPRSFHFLSSEPAFREGRLIYRLLRPEIQAQLTPMGPAGQKQAQAQAAGRLMELLKNSSPGKFRILDARLTPGISDAAPFAENWALASTRTPHTLEPAASGKSTPRGELRWMRFSITLWLPASWKAPTELHTQPAACSE